MSKVRTKKTAKAKKPAPPRDAERLDLPSASSADRNERCNAAHRLCLRVPDRRTPAADRGERIHKALETNDYSGLCKSDRITAERCAYEEGKLIERHDFEGAELVNKEVRMWRVDDSMERIWSAKPDRVYKLGDRALIIDYKTGFMRTTPALDNRQLRWQAAAVRVQYGIKFAVSALIHPNHPDGKPSDFVAMDEAALDLCVDAADAAAIACMVERPVATPGEIQCQWCEAKTICKAYQKEVSAIIETHKPCFEVMKPQQLSDWLKVAKQAEAFIEEGRKYAKEALAKDPASVPGWALSTSSFRNIKDQAAAVSHIVAEFGKDVLPKCVKVSLDKVEELYRDIKSMSKMDALRATNDLFNDCIETKTKAPSLTEEK